MSNRKGPRARITETTAGPEEDGGPRRTKSVFHITINSNQKPPTRNVEIGMRDALSGYVRNNFSDPGFLQELVMFQPGTGEYNDYYIEDVDLDFAIEKGTKRGRIHAHLVLSVVHRSRIRLRRETIEDTVKQQLGYSPYVHITSRGDRTFNLKAYNRKENAGAAALPPVSSDISVMFPQEAK